MRLSIHPFIRKSPPVICAVVAVLFFFGTTVFASRLPVRIYTSADGLGSSFVDSVYTDSRGFVWASTRDGLSRFDGAKFVNYRVGERDSAPGIENLYEMKDGRYLISTTGGTFLYDPAQMLTPDPAEPRLKAAYVSGWRGRFMQDSSGKVWIASGRIFNFVETDGKPQFAEVALPIPPRPNTSFSTYEVAETADGSIWILTSWGLVRKLPDDRIVVYQFSTRLLGGAGAVSLMTDSAGRVWVYIVNAIYVIKPELPEIFNGAVTLRSLDDARESEVITGRKAALPEVAGEIFRLTGDVLADRQSSSRLYQTRDGDVWITASKRLLQIQDGVLTVHSSSEGLPTAMGRMTEDVAGNLWIGGQAGLARLNHQGMITFGEADGAASDQFLAIREGPDGALYFAGPNSNITRFDGSDLTNARPAVKPNSQNIWTSRPLLVDSKGDFWVLTSGELHRFSSVSDFRELQNRKPTRTYTTADGLPSEGMFQIFEDSKGDIWVATRSTSAEFHGVARLRNGTDRFVAFTSAEGLPPRSSPSSFAEDRAGNVWVSFYDGGIAKFDGERFSRPYRIPDTASPGLVTDVHLDAKGRIWFATATSGLYRIDDPSRDDSPIVRFTTGNGLRSNNIRTITEDGFGRIYLGTASGVARLDPDTGLVKNYTVSDGLAADFVVDSHRDRDGSLWFATFSGISRLVPTDDEQVAAPRVFIGGLRINGTAQPMSELGVPDVIRGELEYSENNLQIEFFGLDFRAAETLRYQYKLEGADNDWSVPTELRLVTFANLQPADYRFLVRAVNSSGAVSVEPAVVSFRILSPVWARWWFIALCALAVILVAVLFYRYRTARLREINVALAEANRAEENLRRSREERLAELEQVRSRIATDLHDDIGASLTQIAILSEVAQTHSREVPAAAGPLSKISNVSNELVSTMSDIVWAINPAKDHLADLTHRMRRFASDVLSSKGITFQLQAPDDELEFTLGAIPRREVFLIFKEALNNAVRHSGATNLVIDFEISADGLVLSVTDNGRGFSPDELFLNSLSSEDDFGGNGLNSMKRRAAEIGGTLSVDSKKGNGTTVRLALPLGQKGNKTTLAEGSN